MASCRFLQTAPAGADPCKRRAKPPKKRKKNQKNKTPKKKKKKIRRQEPNRRRNMSQEADIDAHIDACIHIDALAKN